jgi:hypothetical protein
LPPQRNCHPDRRSHGLGPPKVMKNRFSSATTPPGSAPSPLSSRPKRSAVERSAVQRSFLGNIFSTERSVVEGPAVLSPRTHTSPSGRTQMLCKELGFSHRGKFSPRRRPLSAACLAGEARLSHSSLPSLWNPGKTQLKIEQEMWSESLRLATHSQSPASQPRQGCSAICIGCRKSW